MRLPMLFVVCLLASPAAAQDWFLRDGDTRLSFAGLTARLLGNTLTFFDDGEARFFRDESYSYTYSGSGGVARGHYKIFPDSTVCIDFSNGFSRCDLFVINGARLIMATTDGTRFPIRSETPGIAVGN